MQTYGGETANWKTEMEVENDIKINLKEVGR
jgi:hypothetical protein